MRGMATPLARAPLPRALPLLRPAPAVRLASRGRSRATAASGEGAAAQVLRTCKNCKQQYDPSGNHPSACRYHTAHFGGETKRKFESVYAGGTMDTPNSGKVFQYWHCCGSEDPFDVGCTASPHCSYDD
ncbi:hypothetical protein BDA96_05G108300 [Sorghum bicolor]|uniref:CHORD domain-containing protein n=2 Tax=Sorghum bicolor TaxID=4558 RepID=A0A921QZ67_SORBI|nr:uncharacterized protein LOC8071010 [Sorghum bicolor]EES14884.1 hypothetical protein SORBI_3007G107100 [Sorghum bicolor]KAG0529551.1 hypothetical protein BDA96_05G108300 [Sorghum bicolor]|eukprot:XP_002445389.1 uncharacterized protein LOC8071010 [Sorghum bicolor]